jgi:hypothetical protein
MVHEVVGARGTRRGLCCEENGIMLHTYVLGSESGGELKEFCKSQTGLYRRAGPAAFFSLTRRFLCVVYNTTQREGLFSEPTVAKPELEKQQRIPQLAWFDCECARVPSSI